MINTQTMLSQFHLANSSTGTNTHHYLSDKKHHVMHKHSQSFDANSSYNGPYIAISECISGKPFMYKQNQQQQQQKPSSSIFNQIKQQQDKNINNNNFSLGHDHLVSSSNLQSSNFNSLKSKLTTSTLNPNLLNFNNQLSIFNNKQNQLNNKLNCESRVVLHTRSNSNIVLGSKQQYTQQQQQLHNHFLNQTQSTICTTDSQKQYFFNQLTDSQKTTNRHLRIYEKNELANSRSLIDVSQTNLNQQFNPQLKLNSLNQHHQQRSINSFCDKFNNLSLNNNYLNSNQQQNCDKINLPAPPRPPKPVNLRINSQLNDNLLNSNSVNFNNNNSFNDSFSIISTNDDKNSPLSKNNYYQINSTQQSYHQRPKNSLSSSCSSNASPFYDQNNAQDSVFVYDQNTMTNYQPFNHSTSRLNSFEDESDRSPIYFNNNSFNLNSTINSNQTSPNNLKTPPAFNRDLKPKKQLNEFKLNKISELDCSSSYYQTNNLINNGPIDNYIDENLYDNNFLSSTTEDHCQNLINETAIQYLDLDLASIQDDEDVSCSQQSSFKDDFKEQLNSTIDSNESKESHTVYKTVDFIKTKAFNKLRSNCERHD